MSLLNFGGIFAALAMAVLPQLAGAVPLAFGATVPLSGTTAAAEPALAGAVAYDDVTSLFLETVPDSIFAIGTEIQNRVVRSALDGTLIFAPRLSTTFNNTGGTFLVDSMTL